MAVSDRVDAKRNRALLTGAARALLGRDGIDVSVREIAREAGVGVGTLYRHFPTRDDLVDAVLEDAFEEVVEAGERAVAEEDGWTGFVQFVDETLALAARNRGLKDVVETQQRGRARAVSMRRRLRPVISELVRRAQEQGSLRADFTPQDLFLLFWGADRVIALTADVAPELWRRQLGFVLDGLRAGAATQLAHPSLTDAQLQRVGQTPRRRARVVGSKAA